MKSYSQNHKSSHTHVPPSIQAYSVNEHAVPPADSSNHPLLFAETNVQNKNAWVMFKDSSFMIIRKLFRNQLQCKLWNVFAHSMRRTYTNVINPDFNPSSFCCLLEIFSRVSLLNQKPCSTQFKARLSINRPTLAPNKMFHKRMAKNQEKLVRK